MASAQYLLGHTNSSIEQITEQIGYGDVFDFSKYFKQSMGQSLEKVPNIQKITSFQATEKTRHLKSLKVASRLHLLTFVGLFPVVSQVSNT